MLHAGEVWMQQFENNAWYLQAYNKTFLSSKLF
jgi:hypothetical protein